MAAAKKSKAADTKVDDAATGDAEDQVDDVDDTARVDDAATGDAEDQVDDVDDTARADDAAKSGGRPPLVRNVNIDGVWYGPAWGNADAYPDEGHDGRPELFGD